MSSDAPLQTEADKIACWRLRELIRAGYPLSLASSIAESDVDLHRAVELVTVRGCSPETAAEILL